MFWSDSIACADNAPSNELRFDSVDVLPTVSTRKQLSSMGQCNTQSIRFPDGMVVNPLEVILRCVE